MLTAFATKICVDTKLFVNNELYQYLEEMRFRLRYKMLPISYSNLLSHESRTGIKETEKVMDLTKLPNFPYIMLDSENFIHKNLKDNEKNSSK